jgi:hypothetical protein
MASERPEPNDRRVELEQRLTGIKEQYWDLAVPVWHIRLGQFHIRRRYPSEFFFKVFVVFNLVLLTVGVVLSFRTEGWQTVGTATVVGTLFSVGAFLPEVWAQTVDHEREPLSVELHALREEGNALMRELNAMEETHGEGER